MKTKLKLHFLLLLAVLSAPGLAQAQGTAFAYQGRLEDGGLPANGNYDFLFTVHDAEADGNALGQPVRLDAIAVSAGQFVARLDYGAGVFTGAARWLQISVRPAGVGAHTVLAPRQALLATPYAIHAGSAGTVASGTVTANQLNTGGVAPAPGQFLSYNGGNLFWSDPGVAAGNIWSVLNNNAYYTAGSVGIGTSTPANKLTVRTPTLGYGIEHTDGDIRLSTFVGRGTGYLGTLSNHKLTFFANDNGFPNMTMTLDTAGGVGIGTDSPTAGIRLEVNGAVLMTPGNGRVQFGSPNAELGMSIIPTRGNRADLRFSESTLKLVAGPGPGPPPPENGIVISTAGNVGIGTANPGFKLDVLSRTSTAIVGRSTTSVDGVGAGVYGESAQFNGVRGLAHNPNHGGVVGIHDGGGIAVYGTGATGVQGDSSSAGGYGGYFRNTAGGIGLGVQGTARVGVLEITGGADFAENFDVHVTATSHEAKTTKVEAGMVVSIDPINPGKLALSSQAYDRRVAGIISGAGGVKPGMMMSQAGTLADGQYPVALTGRVYCWVDAAYGSIQPGDLLTTSDTPGHAMSAVDSARSQGAILGKAMTGLKEGKGMVLVLVTLQ